VQDTTPRSDKEQRAAKRSTVRVLKHLLLLQITLTLLTGCFSAPTDHGKPNQTDRFKSSQHELTIWSPWDQFFPTSAIQEEILDNGPTTAPPAARLDAFYPPAPSQAATPYCCHASDQGEWLTKCIPKPSTAGYGSNSTGPSCIYSGNMLIKAKQTEQQQEQASVRVLAGSDRSKQAHKCTERETGTGILSTHIQGCESPQGTAKQADVTDKDPTRCCCHQTASPDGRISHEHAEQPGTVDEKAYTPP
jgi:hypothetical protein